MDDGNTLFWFLVDQPFKNKTMSYLKFTHVQPSVIQETLIQDNLQLMVFGKGISMDLQDKLE